MGQLGRLDFSRVLAKLAGWRAAPPVSVSQDILGVMLLDPQSPYTAFIPWQSSSVQNGVAAQFSIVGVVNNGPPGSVCIVDYIMPRSTVAGDWNLGVRHGQLTLVNQGGVTRRDLEAAQVQTLDAIAILNDVQQLNAALAAFGASTLVPAVGSNIPIIGPWILGPGDSLTLSSNQVNNQTQAYFSGRYYPPA